MFKMSCFLVLCVLLNFGCAQIIRTNTTVETYQIAGIFNRAASTQKCAFNDSMRSVHSGEYKFDTIVVEPRRSDSYSMWRDLCARPMTPIAVVGPQTPIADGAIRQQCTDSHIPHIQAAWQPLDPDSELRYNKEPVTDEGEEEVEPEFLNISINFYPDSDELSIALARLLKFYKWESFTVLYEDDFGLMRMQKVLAEYSSIYPIIVRRLDPEAIDNKEIFKELYRFQESRILLDCHADHIKKYMSDASIVFKESSMVSYYQHYIFASMDAATVAGYLETLDCNSTWLSLTRYDDLKISPLSTRVGKWHDDDEGASLMRNAIVPNFELEALIMDDIANHLVTSLSNTKISTPPNLCGKDDNGLAEPWQDGIEFQAQLLNTTSTGITGHVQFDKRGRRVNYTLYVNEIYMKTRHIVGSWSSNEPLDVVGSQSRIENNANKKNSKEFRIISKITKPYFSPKIKCDASKMDCEEDPHPELKYEGFAVDLVVNLFKKLQEEGYNYTYTFPDDQQNHTDYGKYDVKKKKWDGMIGDLLSKKADLAVCDFTITEKRKKIIDFSVPFMTLGISILYVQDVKIPPGMFSFLNPYTLEVWIYIGTAYCVVSMILYICARLSPEDWENPEPCDKDPEFLENIWTFKNCLWLTMGSIMTQGCDILPKAFGTRWVCGVWWFFAVIVCQTYIAQLSASMTSLLAEEPINSVEDLAKQTKILYGAYRDGTTYGFFKSSSDKVYQQIFKTMQANDALLTGGSDEGEMRVLKAKGKYAFFMESSTIEYKLKRECKLKKVGFELDSKDYGIAMPRNSPFRSDINRAILKLREQTILDKIKDTWWEKKYGAKDCELKTNANDVEGDLEMENLEGAFIVLVGGLLLSLVITAAEFANEVRNIVIREQVTHKEVFIKELKASLNFFQLQKPVLRNPSRAPSVDLSEDEEKPKQSALENFMDFEKVVQ